MSDENKNDAPPGGPQVGKDQPVEPDREEPLEERLDRLTRELEMRTREAAENYDRYLRERAELENFKKRMLRERAEAIRFANEELLRDLVPVLDNLERAVEHAESGGDGKPLVEGVRLVLKSALDVLQRHGVSRVEAVGEAFDPSRHEAVMQVAEEGREPNRVVQQFLPGYCLHDRVLRPAQVSVSTAPPVEKGDGDD